jgi:hypothetical protein
MSTKRRPEQRGSKMRTLWLSSFFIGMILICACTDQKPSSVQTFLITWENADSFEDAPDFADRKIDKKTSRFVKPGKPEGDRDYFPDGKIQISLLDHVQSEVAARIIGEAVAEKVFQGYAKFKVKAVRQTRFGYYVFVDWGVSEEGYTGHILYLMIDLNDRIIWWFKCD